MADNPRIEELRRRVQLDPASIAFAALAEEFRRMGRHEDAIDTCRSGLLRHPAYLSARVTLGRALIETGDYEGAREELETVLRSAPENLAAIRGLAQINERIGHSSEMDPHLAALMNAEVERIALAAVTRPAAPAPVVETRSEPAVDIAAIEIQPGPIAPLQDIIVEAAAELVLATATTSAIPFHPEASFDAEPAFDPESAFDLERAFEPHPRFEPLSLVVAERTFDADASFEDALAEPNRLDPVMVATLARLERFLVAIDAARHP